MNRWLALLLLIGLTGCTGMELTERSFVLGVAVDLTKEGRVVLTAQMYRASQEKADKAKGGAAVNIRTEGETLFEAARNILNQLGRKAHWGHMQMIFIGEDLVRSPRFKDVLDYFYRDEESRLTTRISVTEGKAASYLQTGAFQEQTSSRQARNIQNRTHRFSGKTGEQTLLKLYMAMQSESATAIIPYVKHEYGDPKMLHYLGGAVIREGRFAGMLPSDQMPPFLMLNHQFGNGVLNIPCDNGQLDESFEVLLIETHMAPQIRNGRLFVPITMQIEGSIRELSCSRIDTKEDSQRFARKVQETVENKIDLLMSAIKERRMDVLEFGNRLYQRKPGLWNQWKEDWPEQLSQLEYEVHLTVHVANIGLEGGRSAFEKTR